MFTVGRHLRRHLSHRVARSGWVGVAAVLATMSGCTSPTASTGPSACVLGTGVLLFIPIGDGDGLPIQHGGQGGYHLWGSALVHGLDSHGVALHFEYTDDDTGEVVNKVNLKVDLMPADPALIDSEPGDGQCKPSVPDGATPGVDASSAIPRDAGVPNQLGGWGVVLGQTVFLPDHGDAGVDYLLGRHLRMALTATDPAGHTAADSRVVIPCH